MKESFWRQYFDIFILIILMGLFLFLFISHLSLLYEEAKIKKSFLYFVGMMPKKEEIAFWVTKDKSELEHFLEESSERKVLINEWYKKLVGRDISFLEIQLEKDASLELILDRISHSQERIEALEKMYRNMLGRPLNSNELFFHVRVRTHLLELQKSLNNSEERKKAIMKTYKDLIKREPTLGELGKHIVNFHTIEWIRVTELHEGR